MHDVMLTPTRLAIRLAAEALDGECGTTYPMAWWVDVLRAWTWRY
jgi:hypothetical protein